MEQVRTYKMRTRFSWSARSRSVTHAWRGIYNFFRTEHNAWLHLGASASVGALSIWYGVVKSEAVALVFCIALVWCCEMLNTVAEKTMDLISPDYHPMVKEIKDIAAGAVLIASIASLAVGLLIFIPKIFF